MKCSSFQKHYLVSPGESADFQPAIANLLQADMNGINIAYPLRTKELDMKWIMMLLAVGTFATGCSSSHHAAAGNILAVSVKTSPCFGTCPVYEMTILSDKKATYNAIRFNKDQEGIYQATIKEDDFKQLISLLQATNFASLQDEYKPNVTDLPGVDLEITYNKNQVKKIHDYGARGTEELKRFYDFVSGLRNSQDWKKLK